MTTTTATANTLSISGLIERMGSDATDEEARIMRSLLIEAGLGDTPTTDIDEATWDGMIQRSYETATYTASICDPTRDELVDVDIRTLSADRLAKLRTEAGEAGDIDLVAAIDSLR